LVVLQDVADALAAVAKQGIIHRDIKPGNVFVLPNGRAKLGDFGLARALADPSMFRTAGGPALGTPAYFPPEVSQGGEPDERSDAYSFAIMAYEVLTGERPFDAPDALSLVMAHWTKEPVPAPAVLPGFPEAAWRSLQRGMDKDPARRPLPKQLMAELDAVPAARWPEVTRRTAAPLARRSDPTLHQPSFQPGGRSTGGSAPLAQRRTGRGSRRWLVRAAIAVAAAVVATVVGWLMLKPDPGLQVTSIRVEVDPGSGAATCPRGSFVFTAVLRTNGSAGTLRLQWARPDGVTTSALPVEVKHGQREVHAQLPFTVRGNKPLTGDAEIRVLSPEARSASRSIRYDCPHP
jgi:Protein kinase domain